MLDEDMVEYSVHSDPLLEKNATVVRHARNVVRPREVVAFKSEADPARIRASLLADDQGVFGLGLTVDDRLVGIDGYGFPSKWKVGAIFFLIIQLTHLPLGGRSCATAPAGRRARHQGGAPP